MTKFQQLTRFGVLALALASVTSCTLMPDYKRPFAPLSKIWPGGTETVAQPTGAANVAQTGWQGFVRSAELQALIGKALANNRDLRVAALNIEEARALYRVQRSYLAPSVSADGTMTRQRQPGTITQSGQGETTSTYSANIGTSAYELDLFGRLRSLNRAAFEQYMATEEARNAVQISLVSEITNAYLTLLADKAQLNLATQTLEAQQRAYDLADLRFKSGVGTKLDLRQAETLLETAKVDQVAATRLIAQDHNALELLAGMPVQQTELAGDFGQGDTFFAEIAAGLPSDLLQNRPDIRQAEHALKAANANIGAARAAFFPTISLTATGGTAASDLSDLFKGGSAAWSFVPQVTMPIFTAGRNKGNLDVAKLRKDITIAQYEKAIQTGFREVADALVAKATLGEELAAQRRLVAATQDSYRIAEARYKSGVDNYLSVLDARRTLYSAQQQEIATKLAQLQNRVTLYAALGGGQDMPQQHGKVATKPAAAKPVAPPAASTAAPQPLVKPTAAAAQPVPSRLTRL